MSKYFRADLQDGELILDFSESGASRETLTSFILTPVLFPALCEHDNGMLEYVEKQYAINEP